MFADLNQWLLDFEQHARRAGDHQRLHMMRIYRGCWHLFETDPDQAQARLTQARDLAASLHEDCWRIFFDHWLVDFYLYYRIDVAKALDIVVRIASEVRKHPRCPARGRVIRHLINAYLESDPVGYSTEITGALDYLEAEVALDQDTWRAIPDQRADLLVALECLPEALDQELNSLDRSQGSDFRLMHVCRTLCKICFGLGRPEEVLDYAVLGENNARQAPNAGRVLAALLLWQAYYHRHQGDTAAASSLYQQAMNTIARQRTSLLDRYFDPLCAYLEADGSLDAAIRARTLELTNGSLAHSPHRESMARLKRCRLLALAGTLTAAELEAARVVSTRLKDPSRYLAGLDRIATGDTSRII
ncbi:MAG TPA: hypothetical protein VMT34_03450 [Aggregatilineales bacterium]|nr:hypothetical protein [Aggregatilineales bacterium]